MPTMVDLECTHPSVKSLYLEGDAEVRVLAKDEAYKYDELHLNYCTYCGVVLVPNRFITNRRRDEDR